MRLLRPLGLATLLVGLVGAMSSCLTAPTYSPIPSIDFKKMTVDRYYPPGRQQPIDTFRITVSFKDGDGDLGLKQDEITKPPYDGVNQYNYYLRLFRRDPQNQQFEEIYPDSYFSNYPPLYGSEYKPAPLKGELVFKQALAFGTPLNAGDEVRFEVSIKDRALHESNVVTTNTYTVPVR